MKYSSTVLASLFFLEDIPVCSWSVIETIKVAASCMFRHFDKEKFGGGGDITLSMLLHHQQLSLLGC